MPVKRSRIGRSSSFGETDLFNRLTSPTDSAANRRLEMRTTAATPSSVPVNNPAKLLKPSVSENSGEPQRKLLTLSSPDQECAERRDQRQIQGFLEKCYYCRKKIRDNAEVYMYSYLRAFCTAECREIQISMDKEMENEKSEKMAGVHHG